MTGAPLRIGITCFPTFGGSGIIGTEIGLSLAKRGHRVHFICSALPSCLDEPTDNIVFHRVQALEYPLFDSPYALALASKMAEVSQAEKLQLLHVHYAIPHATSALLAKQILGPRAPRVITTLHGTDITVVGSDPSFLPIARYSIAQSDGVTVPSASLKEDTFAQLEVPRTVPIEVIPNFVDTRLFSPAPGRGWANIRAMFPDAGKLEAAGGRPRVLVHNSNFRPVKRVEDVVRIFAAVRREVPCALALIGDGPERPRILALLNELGLAGSACFIGERRDFVEVLQSSDVFLLPSALESFGLAGLEALSCGVPVVGSRIGGVPEVVADGATGFLHPVGDTAAMATSVLRLLKDDGLRGRMSKAARASVEAQWRREPMVDRYEDYYRRVLSRAPTS